MYEYKEINDCKSILLLYIKRGALTLLDVPRKPNIARSFPASRAA